MLCFSWLQWNCKDSMVMKQTAQGGKKYLHLIYTQQALLLWCIFACISVCSCFESTFLLFFCIQLSKLNRHEMAWTSLNIRGRAKIRNFLFWYDILQIYKTLFAVSAHCTLPPLSVHALKQMTVWHGCYHS